MKRIILPGLLLLAAFGNAQEAIRYNPGFFQTPLTRGDDATSEPAPLGFNINFFGRLHGQVYVNTNGNITLSRPLEAYRPLPLRDLRSDIIAPFWADVDTRGPGSRVVTFGYDFVDGHFAFAANWVDVGYFSQKQDKKNAFQVVIIDRT
ncbi:MAG: VPLPA-CTERM sorting domain-containing protein, partial [Acidobacteria bacterium]|nr:VPLPA-CTERM sorting domain-containing protein [Acidobacteriota bacterium]